MLEKFIENRINKKIINFFNKPLVLLIFFGTSITIFFALQHGIFINIQQAITTKDTDTRLITIEHSKHKDTIYTYSGSKFINKEKIAEIEHLPNWSINASHVNNDSNLIMIIPNNTKELINPRFNAEIIAYNLQSKKQIVIGGDADLLVKPLFDEKNKTVYYRSTSHNQETRLIKYNLNTRIKKTIFKTSNEMAIFPIFANKNNLYVIKYDVQGSKLMIISDMKIKEITHLSDHFIRDWSISDDKNQLLFIEQEATNQYLQYNLKILNINNQEYVEFNFSKDSYAFQKEILSITGNTTSKNRDAINYFKPIWLNVNEMAFGTNSVLLQNNQPISTFNINTSSLDQLIQPLKGLDTPIAFDSYGKNMLVKNIQPEMNYLEKIYVINNELKTRLPIESNSLIIYANWWYLN
ncbi:MAG: hypothetical protein ACJ0J6_04270 [Dehalococcoidia bacterium]